MSEQETWEAFKEMLNNNPYGVMKTFQAKDQELAELRAWKAKARPFILVMEAQILKSLEDGWVEGMEDDVHDEHEKYLKLEYDHDTLTELLKEES